MVTADGVLLLPEIGSFRIAGLTLAEARARIETALRQTYRNVPTEVALAQPRQFYVHVSGEVERPGRHVMGHHGGRLGGEAAPDRDAEDVARADEVGRRIQRALQRDAARGEDPVHRLLPCLLGGQGTLLGRGERRRCRRRLRLHRRAPAGHAHQNEEDPEACMGRKH